MALAAAAAIDPAALTAGNPPTLNLRFEGALLTGPFTCGDARFLRLDGQGSVRLRSAPSPQNPIDSGSFSQDAGPADAGPGDAAPSDTGPSDAGLEAEDDGPTLFEWSARWLHPLLSAEHEWGVFETGFGSLGAISQATCAQGLPVGLNVRTWRWAGVVPIARHLAEGLATDNLGESIVIQVSDEVVACPQLGCGY